MKVVRTRRRHSLNDLTHLSGHAATYRMLDYWARTGRIDLGRAPGTGNWRDLSAAEAAAVLDVIRENHRLHEQLDHVRSGDFYRDRLAWHAEHPSDPWANFIGPGDPEYADGEKPA